MYAIQDKSGTYYRDTVAIGPRFTDDVKLAAPFRTTRDAARMMCTHSVAFVCCRIVRLVRGGGASCK